MIIKVILSISAVIGGWIGVLAGVMLWSEEAPAALVMFPDRAFLAALPAGVAITGQSAVSVTLTSDAPDFAQALYAAGAPLVLPAGLFGCAPKDS